MMIRRQMTLCWVALCSTGGMLLLVCGEARPEDQGGQVADFLSKMQERRNQVRSVRYVVKGNGMVAKGAWVDWEAKTKKMVPGKDHHYDIRLFWLIDFEKNRLRKEFGGQTYHGDAKSFVPNRYIHVYDGSGSKRLFPREENTSNDYAPPERGAELGIIKNGNNVDMDITDFPVFLAHGVIPTSRHPIERSDQLRRPLEATDYQVRDHAVLRGKACSILRTTPIPITEQNRTYEELWVESGRGLVHREDSFIGGELYARTDIEYQGDNLASWVTTEFKNSAGQATSPGQPRRVSSVAGQIVRVSRFTVQEFEVNPFLEAKDFDITMKAGMNVTVVDIKAKIETDFDKKDYRVAPDGKTLQELIDGKVVRRWPLLLIVLTGIVLGCAAYLVFWIGKRRKANVTKSTVDRS